MYLGEQPFVMKAMNPIVFRVIIRLGLISSTRSNEKGAQASQLTEQKYILHSTEKCFGKCYDQKFITDSLGGSLGSSSKAVKQYNKTKNIWMKELKAIKKQKKCFI